MNHWVSANRDYFNLHGFKGPAEHTKGKQRARDITRAKRELYTHCLFPRSRPVPLLLESDWSQKDIQLYEEHVADERESKQRYQARQRQLRKKLENARRQNARAQLQQRVNNGQDAEEELTAFDEDTAYFNRVNQ